MDVVKKKENGDEVEEELFLYREEIDFNNIFYLILIDRIVKIFYFFILNYKIFLLHVQMKVGQFLTKSTLTFCIFEYIINCIL